MRLLVIGDVVGRPGRRALAKLLPELRETFRVDGVLANVENLAHGKGVTEKTLGELISAGVDAATSGNHILAKDGAILLESSKIPLLRPANFPEGTPGKGAAIVPIGEERLLLVNLIGTTFFREGATYANPFETIDRILAEYANEQLNGILVDWHAEATSEKVALGWHLDGRVSALFGTHTHVPTDDLRILPNGTAYRTDLGMTGLRDGVLGVDRDLIIHNFLHPDATIAHRWSEEGLAQFHGTLLEIDPKTGHAVSVEKVDRELEV